MDRSDVQAWLDRYVEAWRANEPGPIEALFTDDVTYADRPYGDHAARGIEEVVDYWLGDSQDDPETWDAHYEVFAMEGDRAVAVGTSHYHATDEHPARTFHNVFLLTFAADGRCREYVELYMREDPD